MRSVSVRLSDLDKITIPIGFVGENLYTSVNIDCKEVFDKHPSAVPSLSVTPPKGDSYPAVTTRDGDIVTWVICDSDLVYKGTGEIQLAFTVDGEMIGKSYPANTRILRSIEPSGTAPTPVANWLVAANAALNEIPQDIADGIDEFMSALVGVGQTLQPNENVTVSFDVETKTLTIGVPKGADGNPGQPGQDGYSPTATVSKSGDTVNITITDKNGTTTATVKDGKDGEDGDDGFSPVATVSKNGKVVTISITDKNGTTTATVSDGESATDIIDDNAGSGDTAKVWSADKTYTENQNLLSQIQVLEPSATSGDVGKVPKVKTVTDGKVSEYEFGSLPSVPVTDVQVNGTSVLSQGVANVPVAGSSTLGVVKISGYGLYIGSSGLLSLNKASASNIKGSNSDYAPIVPSNQDASVFYGLAKCSGDTTQSSSANAVGVYTDAAKRKITDMIEPQFRKIYDVTLSEDTEVIYTDTDLNGLAFALKEVVIEFDLKAGASSGIGAIIVNNGSSNKPSTPQRAELPYIAVSKLYDTSAQFRVAHLWVSGGRFFGNAEYTNFSNGDTPLYIQQSKNSRGIISCSSINDILIVSLNSYTFKTASKITIYGR